MNLDINPSSLLTGRNIKVNIFLLHPTPITSFTHSTSIAYPTSFPYPTSSTPPTCSTFPTASPPPIYLIPSISFTSPTFPLLLLLPLLLLFPLLLVLPLLLLLSYILLLPLLLLLLSRPSLTMWSDWITGRGTLNTFTLGIYGGEMFPLLLLLLLLLPLLPLLLLLLPRSSAPDSLKSHDLQYWSPPLQFDDTTDPPTILPITFVSNFTIVATY